VAASARYGSSAYGSSQRNRESAKRSAASQEARRDGCGKATEISSLGKHMIGARTDPYQWCGTSPGNGARTSAGIGRASSRGCSCELQI